MVAVVNRRAFLAAAAAPLAVRLGAPAQAAAFAVLMHPCAFAASDQPYCLYSSHFQYEIVSRDVTA